MVNSTKPHFWYNVPQAEINQTLISHFTKKHSKVVEITGPITFTMKYNKGTL